jgi:indole-3-glycerol phosphate synthase
VNCRNLRDFSTDVTLIERLVGEIPPRCVRVAESGMHSAEAVRRAKNAGADAFLVGTALMRAASPGGRLRGLLGDGLK